MFQSTRPHRARRGKRTATPKEERSFNPRAHTGRDWRRRGATPPKPSFNPRAHTGRDPHNLPGLRRHTGFNPRAHTGRDVLMRSIMAGCRRFQSTRPHRARREARRGSSVGYLVSIHAPTQGATCGRRVSRCSSFLFQSTRPHRARPLIYSQMWEVRSVSIHARWLSRFNPRAHTGRDQRHGSRAGRAGSFNPRAHTGRDPTGYVVACLFLLFQSTRPHRARLLSESNRILSIKFQSTRPHRARLAATRHIVFDYASFNPRAHTGRDG